jgi:cobalt/nickel transport system ATP-binding protein
MSRTPLIEMRSLRFGYARGKRLFEGLDFTLLEGERVGVVGANGTGKSTLLRLIMGLEMPEGGELHILGEKREKEEDFFEVRRLLGFLFQDTEDQLFCPTVEEDIAFGPLNLGHSHEEARAIVGECTRTLGIQGLEKEVTHRLSGGEKRLVALASVMAMQPLCYILDEPTSGLDETHAGLLLRYLKEHARTALIASHDRSFLAGVTDRIVTLGV